MNLINAYRLFLVTDLKVSPPPTFNNNLNQFQKWPHYREFRRSVFYIAMTKFEKTTNLEKFVLDSNSPVISSFSKLHQSVTFDDAFKSIDYHFLDKTSKNDFLSKSRNSYDRWYLIF